MCKRKREKEWLEGLNKCLNKELLVALSNKLSVASSVIFPATLGLVLKRRCGKNLAVVGYGFLG